ncbi:MAG: PEP-CTERM sorting domain-containing protein [Planctomycetota bacterium]
MKQWIKGFYLFAGVLTLSPVASLAQVNSTWDGTTGNWTDASKWSTADFPENGNGGFDFNAFINGGTVTLDDFIAIEGLEITGGELIVNTPQALTTFQGLDLVGGTISGTGTIDPAALNVLNAATLSGVQIDLQSGSSIGIGSLTDTTTLNNGATIRNVTRITPTRVSGTSLTEASANLFIDGGTGTNRFFNDFGGEFIKPVGDASLTIGIRFDNDGRVEVEQGTLRLNNGGVSAGTYSVGELGTLQLRGTHQLQSGQISGLGTVQIVQGTLSIDENSSYLALQTQVQAGTLEIDRTFQHSTDVLALFDNAEVIDITTGSSNPATFSVERTLEIQTSGGAVATVRGLEFRLGSGFGPQSSVDFLSGQLVLDEGSTINHIGTFDLDLANSGIQSFDITPITAGPTGNNTFNNQFGGLIRKAVGNGELTFDIGFNNEGEVEVDRGELRFNRGGVSTGTFRPGRFGELIFAGGHDLTGANVTGLGEVTFEGSTGPGAAANLIGKTTQYLVGQTTLNSGILTINSNNAESTELRLVSGLLNGTGTITVDFLGTAGDTQVDGVQIVVQNFYSLSSGAIVTTGAGSLDVQGSFELDEESSFKAILDDSPGEIANSFAAQGTGDLSGDLLIEIAPDFTAEVGDIFELFSAQQGITGSFRNLALGESITAGSFTFSLIDPDAVAAVSFSDESLPLLSNDSAGLPTRLALQVDAVPEPGSMGILALGLGLLLNRRGGTHRATQLN